jgi:hypothetical protein
MAVLDRVRAGIEGIHSQHTNRGNWTERFGFSYTTRTDWPGMYNWWYEVMPAWLHCRAMRQSPQVRSSGPPAQ